jgi:glucokinase
MTLYLLLDFGGTKHSAAVWRPGETGWLAQERLFSPPDADAGYDWQTMVALGQRLLSGRQPTAIGVSFGGPVDFARGVVRLSHHVPGWENFPLQQKLEETFAAPAVVDNDANVAALGEYQFGAGQGCHSLLYVTVSTGVGGGWVLNGRPWRGWQGLAGEIGHTVVDVQGPLCLCGKRGCVERLASGPYLAADYAAARPDLATAVTGRTVAELAAQGDLLARQLLQRGAQALGLGLGNAANLLNPERIILGGGVTKAGELWWQTVRQTVQQLLLPEIEVEISPAALADDAPLWGAAALAAQLLGGETRYDRDRSGEGDLASPRRALI